MNVTGDFQGFTTLLGEGSSTVATVGAKAAMLDRIAALGAPVPPSGAVTTAAYRAFTGEPGIAALLERLRSEPIPTPAMHAASQSEIDDAFLAAPWPPGMEEAVRDCARAVARGSLLAVRSSATAEDLADASFAGQYRTFLHVAPEDVPVAVRRCWASLWYPVPREYRRFRAIDDREVAMAALLVPMLNPDVAGVVFTQDPGDSTLFRIETVEGQGEALVSGARTPTVTLVPRESSPAPQPLPGSTRELLDICLGLEAAIGTPLDIEWAVEAGQTFILQARPITAQSSSNTDNDGFDIAGGATVRYTTAGIAEMLPGVQAPRIWELNSWIIEEGLRTLFENLGADLASSCGPHELLGRFRGRAALNLDAMECVIRSVPGGSPEELEHQYFGAVLSPGSAPRPELHKRGGILQDIRTLRARIRAFEESEVVIQAVGSLLEQEPDSTSLDDRQLLTYRGRLVHLASRVAAAEVSVAATASASYRGLERFLSQHFEAEEAGYLMQRMTAPERASLRGSTTLGLAGVARKLCENAAFSAGIEAPTWDEACRRLREVPGGSDFVERIRAALRRAGSAAIFGGTPWEELPDLAWAGFRSPPPAVVSTGDADRAFETVEAKIRISAAKRINRILRGQLLDVHGRFFRREAADARAFLERRELTKASLLMLGGAVWRADREIGRRLAERSRLESEADVDFLTGFEMRDLLGGSGPTLQVIAARRRQHWAAEMAAPLPRLFTGQPGAGQAPLPAGDAHRGWPVSPGRYEGPARIVQSPASAQLRRGEVLIARTTDSSWLPLFHVAGAVVVEEGGPLSHAAILARELGMPAVVNIPGLVSRLEECPGASVMVDGTTGEIRIHGPSPASDSITAGVVPVRDEPEANAPDPGRLNVFITGLIGAGALMSIVIGLTQAIGQSGTQARISRRAAPVASALAAGVARGFDAQHIGPIGLQPKSHFAWLAVVSVMASLVVAWAGSGLYREAVSETGVWLFAVALSTAFAAAALGIAALAAFLQWPYVHPFARRVSALQQGIGFVPSEYVGRRHTTLALSLVGAILLLTFVVIEAQNLILPIDRWILEQIHAGGDFQAWRPGFFDEVFRRESVIPMAVLLTVACFRCRALLFTFPLVIAAGGALHLGIAHFVERSRPDIGPKAGFLDSFPGGHMNEQTIMLGLLPFVIYSLLGWRWLFRLLLAGSAYLVVATFADALRVADHWPSDNLAGLLIGLTMLTIAHGVVVSPVLHRRCRSCPWMRREGAEH